MDFTREQMFVNKILEYTQSHEGQYPPYNYKDEDGNAIGTWRSKKITKLKAGLADDEELNFLKASGIDFGMEFYNWDDWYLMLKKYLSDNYTNHIPKNCILENKYDLSKWAYSQYRHFRDLDEYKQGLILELPWDKIMFMKASKQRYEEKKQRQEELRAKKINDVKKLSAVVKKANYDEAPSADIDITTVVGLGTRVQNILSENKIATLSQLINHMNEKGVVPNGIGASGKREIEKVINQYVKGELLIREKVHYNIDDIDPTLSIFAISELGTRSKNVLARSRIQTLRQLAEYINLNDDLPNARNMGQKTKEEIINVLKLYTNDSIPTESFYLEELKEFLDKMYADSRFKQIMEMKLDGATYEEIAWEIGIFYDGVNQMRNIMGGYYRQLEKHIVPVVLQQVQKKGFISINEIKEWFGDVYYHKLIVDCCKKSKKLQYIKHSEMFFLVNDIADLCEEEIEEYVIRYNSNYISLYEFLREKVQKELSRDMESLKCIELEVMKHKFDAFNRGGQGYFIYANIYNKSDISVDIEVKEFILIQSEGEKHFDYYLRGYLIDEGTILPNSCRTTARMYYDNSLENKKLSAGDYVIISVKDVKTGVLYTAKCEYLNERWHRVFSEAKHELGDDSYIEKRLFKYKKWLDRGLISKEEYENIRKYCINQFVERGFEYGKHKGDN